MGRWSEGNVPLPPRQRARHQPLVVIELLKDRRGSASFKKHSFLSEALLLLLELASTVHAFHLDMPSQCQSLQMPSSKLTWAAQQAASDSCLSIRLAHKIMSLSKVISDCSIAPLLCHEHNSSVNCDSYPFDCLHADWPCWMVY